MPMLMLGGVFVTMRRLNGTLSPEMAAICQIAIYAVMPIVPKMKPMHIIITSCIAYIIAVLSFHPPHTVTYTWSDSGYNTFLCVYPAAVLCTISKCMMHNFNLGIEILSLSCFCYGALTWVSTDDVGDCSAQALFLRAEAYEHVQHVVLGWMIQTTVRTFLSLSRYARFILLFFLLPVLTVCHTFVYWHLEDTAGTVRRTTPANMPMLLVQRRILPTLLRTDFGVGGCKHMQFPPAGSDEAIAPAFLRTSYAKSAGADCTRDNYQAVHDRQLRGLYETKDLGYVIYDFFTERSFPAARAIELTVNDAIRGAGNRFISSMVTKHAPPISAINTPAGCRWQPAGVLNMYTAYMPTNQIGWLALSAVLISTLLRNPIFHFLFAVLITKLQSLTLT